MYVKHGKVSRNKQLSLMKYFVAGSTARIAAELACVHSNRAVRFFHKLREKIALKQQNRIEQFCGKIELDESYFGGVRKGKRCRGAFLYVLKQDFLTQNKTQKVWPPKLRFWLFEIARYRRMNFLRVRSETHKQDYH